MNALVACNDNKECSARLLKEYITEYHPNLVGSTFQHKFKVALASETRDGRIRYDLHIAFSCKFVKMVKKMV